jgi:hypothetical protein
MASVVANGDRNWPRFFFRKAGGIFQNSVNFIICQLAFLAHENFSMFFML